MLSIQYGIAKVNKYASRESGDTVELVERPLVPGGFTAVLVDGQGSGKAAKSVSNFVAAHCVTLIKQGVRDGVVARAANDQLFNYKQGQVSATLNLLTVDFHTQSVVLSRNNPEPMYLGWLPSGEAGPLISVLDEESQAIGVYRRVRPVVREFELKPRLVVVAFSDGIVGAGQRYNPDEKLDVAAFLKLQLSRSTNSIEAQSLADALLEMGMLADRRRPEDDMSVVVLTTQEVEAKAGTVVPRRMSVEVTYG